MVNDGVPDPSENEPQIKVEAPELWVECPACGAETVSVFVPWGAEEAEFCCQQCGLLSRNTGRASVG